MATPFAANNFLKTMRALFRWAKEDGLVKENPAAEVKPLSRKTPGFAPWTEEDVARYRTRWPLGTRQRVALEVFFNTGLRRGDAVRLGRQHVKDGVASLKAEKTGTTLFVPILPALEEAIAAGPAGNLVFICTESGQPTTKESFGNWFREACCEAGVKASAHGLRKLAAATVAEGGGSEKELQALFGWRSNDQSSIYTRNADNRRLAITAAAKLTGNNILPHPLPGAGNGARKSNKIKDLIAIWWARQDSNLEPDGYEPSALTIELRAPPERMATAIFGGVL